MMWQLSEKAATSFFCGKELSSLWDMAFVTKQID
jgi:hypothetical protein